jgi:DNA-binding GntR family transcriptional regulator
MDSGSTKFHLQSALGVSRAPICEALSRLAAEELVEISRTRGALVDSFSPEDVTDLQNRRAGFEPSAPALAGPCLDKDTIDQLAALSVRKEAASSPGSVPLAHNCA